jgi:hydroxypyruvate reductase
VLGLLLSDVVGDDPTIIASGPLSPSSTTPREVEILLRRRRVWDDLPAKVRELIGEEARTLRNGPDEQPPNETVTGRDPGTSALVRVIGGGADALAAASAAATRLGYSTHTLTARLEGEARRAGAGLARAGLAVRDGLSPPAPPACLLAAGETTVEVVGPGKGGRNQEVALGAALRLDGTPGILVASLGTDGVDGPTDAAGALADGTSVRRARELGLDVESALERNDAYPLLDALGDLVRTGPTGTNVADLMLVLIAADSSGR